MKSEHWTFTNLTGIGEIPQAIFVVSGVLALAVGIFLGLGFWRQFRSQAELVELETRREQSDFDLVSRDVFKAKQEALANLESQNQNL